jgi:hypothetical protein
LTPRLTESHTNSSPILVDKFDTRGLKCPANHNQGCTSWLIEACLQLTNGCNADFGCVCELQLRPVEEPAGRPALFGGDHDTSVNRAFSTFLSKIN